MGESNSSPVADDRGGLAIRLDSRVARTTRLRTVLPCASGRGLASAGMGGDECVRRRRILGSATDRGRDSQAARTDLAGRARIMVAAEEFHEPGTVRRRTPG